MSIQSEGGLERDVSSKSSPENSFSIVACYQEFRKTQPSAVATVSALAAFIKISQETTMFGLNKELDEKIKELEKEIPEIPVKSGCALFKKDLSRQIKSGETMEQSKKRLVELGERNFKKSLEMIEKIAEFSLQYFEDEISILTVGFSTVVARCIEMMKERRCFWSFTVYIPEGGPKREGFNLARRLEQKGIHIVIISDTCIAAVMNRIDIVVVGAVAIAENGALINNCGTHQLASVAFSHRKPFYVACESYKFSKVFPLSQRDLENITEVKNVFKDDNPANYPEGIEVYSPEIEVTPPSLITLLWTDKGILTTSAVSDELYKAYN